MTIPLLFSLLLHMGWKIPRSIVLMDKRSVNSGHRFQDVLQRLSQVMAVSQAHILVENNIDLNVKFISGMVGLQALYLLDGLCESHSKVEENVSFIGRCCCAGEIPNVAC